MNSKLRKVLLTSLPLMFLTATVVVTPGCSSTEEEEEATPELYNDPEDFQ